MNAQVKGIKGEEKEKAPRLNAGRIKAAEFVQVRYVVRPEAGVTLEQMLDPAYWTHVSRKMKAGDHVEVIADDNTWYAELLVLAAGPVWAKVAIINERSLLKTVEVAESETTDHPGFEIKWGGNIDKFRVIRTEDNEIISRGHDKKVEAAVWLDEYVKVMDK